MPFARVTGFFTAIIVALSLGACGATLPQTASIPSDANAAGAAYPSTAAEKPEGMPAPFADPSTPAITGREVIANPTIADIMAPSPLPEMSWGSATAKYGRGTPRSFASTGI